MASITFIVPDVAVPRIQAAYGTTAPDGSRIPATVAEFRAALKAQVQGVVANYEAGLVAAATVNAVSQEVW